MDPIAALRKRAQEKRDFAIQLARQIYQRDLAAIDAIDHALPPQTAPEPTATPAVTNTVSLIQSLIPADRPFTVSEMMEWLRAAQPGQKFHEATIRTYVSRLSSRGALKRLYKNGRNYTQWVASESFKKLGPVEAKPLVELVAETITANGQPMRANEIAVQLRDMGYRADVAPATINRAVRDTLARHRKLFRRENDGKWLAQ